MKAKPAGIIGEVICDRESFTLITKNPIHLVLQIIVMDFGVRYLFKKNRASISILSRLPDVQKQSIRLDLGRQGNGAVMDFYSGGLFDGHPVVIIQYPYIFNHDIFSNSKVDPAAGCFVGSNNGGAMTVQCHVIRIDSDPFGEHIYL